MGYKPGKTHQHSNIWQPSCQVMSIHFEVKGRVLLNNISGSVHGRTMAIMGKKKESYFSYNDAYSQHIYF